MVTFKVYLLITILKTYINHTLLDCRQLILFREWLRQHFSINSVTIRGECIELQRIEKIKYSKFAKNV